MSKRKPKQIRDVNAQRDVVMGNQTTNYYVTQVIQVQPFIPSLDLTALRQVYLDHLRRTYRALDFKGIPQLDTFSHELLLEEVYVPLVARPELPGGETWERHLAGRQMEAGSIPEETLALLEKGDSHPVKVEEALGEHPRVVVLGDPGSGKSTLLKYLALRLAAEPDAPLPIMLPLNAYAAVLEKGELNLQDYLPQYFASFSHELSDLKPLFDAAIQSGQAVILLDGLDEVQSERIRPLLVRQVQAFAVEASRMGCKLIVTSRIVGYRESPLAAKDWSLYTLLDFDRQAIEAFAARWCLAFEKSTLGDSPETRQKAETERRSLLDALDVNPGVANLASNPLLLTILALIKRQGVNLPNRRVELYELYLKTLISAWSKARGLDKRPVGQPLDYLQTIAVLGPLALWLRKENPTAGLVPEERLIDWLTAFFQGEDWGYKKGEAMKAARDFLESVRHYSNLLLERGQGRFGFIHLTFEEALAARGLVQLSQLRLDNSLEVIRTHLSDPGWRETILLSVGIWGLVREQPRVAGEVVRAILKMDCEDENACQNVLVAGACLEDVGELGLGRAVANEVLDALNAASLNRKLLPPTQRDAGFSLGRLAGGSPAFLERIRPDLDSFVNIPAGEFLYGDEKKKLPIPEPFAIGRYPVTNLQFRRFVEAGGYEHKDFWSEEGWTWRNGGWDTKAPDYLKDWMKSRPPEKRVEPFYWHDQKWNNPLAPVVGVCWFEAEAYCNWLARELSRPVRLPTEQEWERAARGTKGREYGWGDEFDRCYFNGTELWAEQDNLSNDEWRKWTESDSVKAASTTFVGQFPLGNTAEGISDLTGNVWEWTESWYQKEQTHRVLRGGSWYVDRSSVRCAYRFWYIPGDFGRDVGFRVLFPA
jgi:formylglycine-generating enzyme required for sulfatase activity/energy-coupling factor transporter ATP-binding protein EcfA2